jgi:hypothetical protein
MSTDLRALRSGIVAALICGGSVALGGLPPQSGIVVTQARAAEGIRSVKSVCQWNDVAWKDMAAAEQAAWTTLGWRSETWGSDDPAVEPEITQKEWSELTDGEKQAAAMLGYSQLNWNVEPDPCEAKRPLTKRKRRTASLPSTKVGFRSKAVDLVCPLDALNCVTTKAGELSSPQ